MKICPQCGARYEMDQRFCSLDGIALVIEGAERGDELIGRVIADRYAIVRKLGEGGWGRVYLAEHVRMRRKSAVKIMNPWLAHDLDAIARFNREASNAAQIAHPNVAAIYDFGEAERGLVYLSMEYVEGEPLSQLMHREGPLTPLRAAHLSRQVADGLAAAHELGIVHRDLKPDNILIGKSRSGEDRVKLVDFGIAKAVNAEGQQVTRTGLMIGTPEYMSPEQLSGDPIDARSDIYSLGIVLFAMLTGRLPFPSVTTKETLVARLTKPPLQLWEVNPAVQWPEALQAALNRALAPDPQDRFADVGELARAVTESVAPASIPLAPVGSWTADQGWGPSLSPPPGPQPSPQPWAPPVPITPVPNTPVPSTQAPSTPQPAPLAPTQFRVPAKRLTIVAGSVLGGLALVLVAVIIWTNDSPITDARDSTSLLVPVQPTTPAATGPESTATPPVEKKPAGRGGPVRPPEPQPNKAPETPRPTPELRPSELVARARDDLRKGRQFMDQGSYVTADRWFDLAKQRVDSLRERVPGSGDATTLEREIAGARADNRAACRTEQDLERRRNKKTRDCP